MRKKEYGTKIISIILAAALTAGLAACGNKNQQSPPAPPTEQESAQTQASTDAALADDADTAEDNTIQSIP